MTAKRLIVLGTHNRKKGAELAELLSEFGFRILTLADLPEALRVVEDGETFADNARRKAIQQARHLKRWVLGEDSGLCVDALDGRPGVFSARYSGENASDEANNQRLLEELGELPAGRRGAHYVCHIALADPMGHLRAESEARCCGRITRAPRGQAGFGYDPLFEIPEYHRTFGELGEGVKAVLSHRGRAVRRLIPQLLELADSGAWPADDV